MLPLPSLLAARYRPAAAHEVHAQSFGRLRSPRNPAATTWQERRGTLEDQSIFGPVVDFECACGMYRGMNYKGVICHICGVKLTTRRVRRQRFGHIDLPVPIVHPLARDRELVSAIPVLPAAFAEAPGGERLTGLYDDMVRAVTRGAAQELADSCRHLLELLLPVVLFAHEWDMQEAEVLAWGLILAPRGGPAGDSCSCGYPLEGLDVPACPGCGRKLR